MDKDVKGMGIHYRRLTALVLAVLFLVGCSEVPHQSAVSVGYYPEAHSSTVSSVTTASLETSTTLTTTTTTTTATITTTVAVTTTTATTTTTTVTALTTTTASATTKGISVTTTATAEENGTVVYVTPTGKRYHLIATCGGKNSTAATLEQALRRGLTPCKKCAQ